MTEAVQSAELIRDHDPGSEQAHPVNSRAGHLLAVQNKMIARVFDTSTMFPDPYHYADMIELVFKMAEIQGADREDILDAVKECRRQYGGFDRGLVSITRR